MSFQLSLKPLLIAGLLAGTAAANAQAVFTDTFDMDSVALNKTSFMGGWTVSDGTVDLIGAGAGDKDAMGYDFFPGNGNYVDLDGSTRDAGIFSKSLSLDRGTTYTATFMLAGSQRNFTETVDVMFGTTLASYTFAPTDGFSTYSLTFTTRRAGMYDLSFSNAGGDLEGALLDGVSVTAVPEPSTYALMLAGVACIAYTASRRRPS